MIQKSSLLVPVDMNSIWLVRVFHIYKGFLKKQAKIGSFIKTSVRKIKVTKFKKKLKKLLGFFIRSKFKIIKADSISFFFKVNNLVLLKKRLTPLGRLLYGPIPFNILRRKFKLTFPSRI